MDNRDSEALSNIKIQVVKNPDMRDWIIARKCTLVTVGKECETEPSMKFKHNILAARHSPIRELKFVFYMQNVPSYVATHFARHVHAQPYIKTQRNDRQSEFDRRDAPQDQPVDMMWSVNAEELMAVANKRLCRKADPLTRALMERICIETVKTNPEFEGLLVPNCFYRGGLCTEFDPCGLYKLYSPTK